ncbi:hypothetical protein CN383_00085 [Priestia megaterium]|uniref:hypothetical protein n=1 Tax=Priestia megaterium TaxID=1404 RepID=UPI000BF53C9C|nr:hypothetical protein [Priestia megaterium]PFB07252.1 hypothetical protein CN383_00085 [Priestia megaterium]
MSLENNLTTGDIANIRKTLQLTHKQFADLLGISSSYQKHIEGGYKYLPDAYLQRVNNVILRDDRELMQSVIYLTEVRQKLLQELVIKGSEI